MPYNTGDYTHDAAGNYVGEFRDGLINGQGIVTYRDGTKYVGEFKNGKFNGEGTEYRADGSILRSGIWEGGRWSQKAGTSPSISAGQLSLPPCRGSYTLTWTNCVATFTFSDGRKYVGDFRDGTFNGQGTLTWPNGMTYVGAFKDGNRSGQGTSTMPDGRKYVGEFRDGKTNGDGTEYRADGSILRSGIWEDGVFIRGR